MTLNAGGRKLPAWDIIVLLESPTKGPEGPCGEDSAIPLGLRLVPGRLPFAVDMPIDESCGESQERRTTKVEVIGNRRARLLYEPNGIRENPFGPTRGSRFSV